jgi:imidazolonepropionase-like amidohydrolase
MRGNHILATVLKGATLIDGTGSDPLKDALVVIEAGRIQYAGNAEKTQIPGEAEIIDLTGKTIYRA